jgi:DNA excision repair protein ERCC-2
MPDPPRLLLDDLIDTSELELADPLRRDIGSEARSAYAQTHTGVSLGRTIETILRVGSQDVRIQAAIDLHRLASGATHVETLRVLATDGDDAWLASGIERAAFGALLLELEGEPVSGAAVIDLDPDGRELRRVDVAYRTPLWAARFEQRIDALLDAQRAARIRAREREVLADSLRFPFDKPRAGQDVMLRDVEGAARGGLVLLCSAPTGIGKTAAALLPMLRAALREQRQLFFVTAKTSQQTLALDTLRQLLPETAGTHAIQISARHRVCPIEEHGCADRRCPLQRRFFERLATSGVLETLSDSPVIDALAIREAALAVRLCPFEVALALARRATVVVGDFNYVFDPNARLRDLKEVEDESPRPLLIVDEAHNLAERARGYYSPRLMLERIEACTASLAPLRAPAYTQTRRLLRDVADHVAQQATRLSQERSEPGPWVDAPERSFWSSVEARARAALIAYAIQADAERERPAALRAVTTEGDPRPRDPARSLLYAVRDFARFATLDPDRFAAIWSPNEARMLCVDPGPLLAPVWSSFHAVVCMSATLSPFEHHAQALGVEGPRTERLDLASPFPRSNRLLLAIDAVDTTYRKRSEDAGRVAEIISRAIDVQPGNYLAFFSSFRYRDEVVAKLPAGPARVLLQLPGMPAEPILRQLERNRDGTLLVCGVHGGLLAEGVDYPGHLARGVFVVGPGLPAVDLERELIRSYHDEQSGLGFELAYILPGLTRVVQAAGRAIRGPHDRAFIALLGRRFAEPTYRDPLPLWWQDELVDVSDPVAALRAFWSRGAAAREMPAD